MTKIVCIDDHSLFRYGLKAILQLERNFSLVKEYNTPGDFLKELHSVDLNLVITDLTFDKENSFNMIRQIKTFNRDLKVVVLSMHKEEFYILNSIEAGADGYLHKDIHEEELIRGLKKVINGENYYSDFISQILINNIYNKPRRSNQPFLTPKEKEIVNYLVEGLSSKEISVKMNVSARTVEAHRYNILKKFGLQSTNELIRKVVEQKITF